MNSQCFKTFIGSSEFIEFICNNDNNNCVYAIKIDLVQRTNRTIGNTYIYLYTQSQVKSNRIIFGLKHRSFKRVERKFYNSMKNCCAAMEKTKRMCGCKR